MLLKQLIRSYDPQIAGSEELNVEVTGVQEDSRLIKPGNLFVARSGTKNDGQRFLAAAVAAGAIAAVVQAPVPGVNLPQIVVNNPAVAISKLANSFHGNPSRMVNVLGVTGTNGKTTTTYLIRHILKKINVRCGMVGTVEVDDGKTIREATMTTPGAVEIAELLSKMRDNGCRACAIETSSHALHQARVAGVTFAGAAFTNLTGDHLDYHHTMEDYAAAKAKLFESLHEEAVAVVNAEDGYSDRMIQKCQARIIRFGFGKTADYRARDIAITSQGTNFILHTPDGQAEVAMKLIGRHNIENALTAAALVGEAMGLSVHQIAVGLRDAAGAPGRLQSVVAGQPFAVLVDYAHTDDALENVLTALRPLTRGKLRVLFGCGGDRDATKRPRMAKTAARLADRIYITSDNPRTEEPDAIISQILAGIPNPSDSRVTVDPDRHSAIAQILNDAEPGDIVLLAGKGHENYQIVGTTKHHFDDVEEATQALTQKFAAT